MSNTDFDDIISIDSFINDFILSGRDIEKVSTNPIIDMIAWSKILDRCIERDLLPRPYKHASFITMKAEILKYTGDIIQQELIKQWIPNRHFYFCYNKDIEQDFLFSPGTNGSVSAKPGEYLVLTQADGFSAISKNEFNYYWYLSNEEI